MAIRVPVSEFPSVQSEGLRTAGPSLVDAPDAGRDISQVGRTLVDVSKTLAEAQAQADSLRVTEALTEYERRTSDTLQGQSLGRIDAAFEGRERAPGFLETRGKAAAEKSTETVDALQKHLAEVADSLLPRQRRAFTARANALAADARRRIESHVGAETRRAMDDGLKAASDEALRTLGADPLSPAMGLRVSMVERAIESLATSPEDAEARKQAFRGDVALTRIKTLVANGDIGTAEAVFAESREALGVRTDDVQALLTRAKKGDEKRQLQVQATAQAQVWLREATPAGGYADSAKVLQQLQAVPADDARREALEVEVRQQLQVEAERRRADTQRHRELAWQADLGRKPTPPSSLAYLEQFDPDFLRGLRNEREARWRRWKADNEGTAADKAAARRKQAEDDEFLRLRFASLPPEEQARTTPEEFARTLAAEYSDFSPTRNGYAAAGKVKADTVQRLEKGDVQAERRFVAEAEREVMALVTKKGKVDPTVSRLGDPRTLVSGRASEFYRSKRAALGRDPTPDEEQAWLGELKLQPEPGWFQSKPPPAVLQPGFLPGGYGAPLPARPPSAPSTRPAPRPAGADVGTKTDARRAAEAWLAANPNHPRAEAVRRKLEAMQ